MSLEPMRGQPAADGQSPGRSPAPSTDGETIDEVRCVARHLVVAASQLARDDRLPRDLAARYAAAEARLRSHDADLDGMSLRPAAAVPLVRLATGEEVAVTALFAASCRREQWRLPHRSIDPELVHAAKELLSGLVWRLPDEAGARP